MGEPRSHKQQRERLVRALRAQGKSRVEVAEALRQRYRFNARTAFRYAHEWSQRQAADEWNKRWPDELKTFKNFSYWESWPSRTGHAPTFDHLGRLAEIYECAVCDLLVDLPDFRHLDTVSSTQAAALAIPKTDAEIVLPGDFVVWATATGLALPDTFVAMLMQHLRSLEPSGREVHVTPRDRDRAYHQLVQFLRSWAHTMDRRDAPIIENIEAVLWRCRRQDYALGPQAVLTTVLAQLDLARALLPDCPPALRPRMLSALSEASRQAGWLSFDLQRFDHAGYYYEDARALAHEAQNTGLGAFVLCEMSHLATWRGAPRIGIDHAVAAAHWADRTDDLRLRAYTADVVARAYAADGQRDACLTALDTAHIALTRADDQAPSYSTYTEAVNLAHRGSCHLELGEWRPAAEYIQQSLTSLDRSNVRNAAFFTAHLGMAHVQCNEIDEAARLLGDAGEIASRHSSVRLIERLKQDRAELQPWNHTPAVRQLDERLVSCGMA